MRVLLDEDVPRYLKRELSEHDVSTVREKGWEAMRNGVLLGLAESAGFDVVLTCDRNIRHQQKIAALRLAIVVLFVWRKCRDIILPLVPEIKSALAASPQPGTLTVVGSRRMRNP